MFQMLEGSMAPWNLLRAAWSRVPSPPIKDGPEVRPGFKPMRFRSLFDAKHKIFSNLLTKTVDMQKFKKEE